MRSNSAARISGSRRCEVSGGGRRVALAGVSVSAGASRADDGGGDPSRAAAHASHNAGSVDTPRRRRGMPSALRVGMRTLSGVRNSTSMGGSGSVESRLPADREAGCTVDGPEAHRQILRSPCTPPWKEFPRKHPPDAGSMLLPTSAGGCEVHQSNTDR